MSIVPLDDTDRTANGPGNIRLIDRLVQRLDVNQTDKFGIVIVARRVAAKFSANRV
jgi:hypothetical protein